MSPEKEEGRDLYEWAQALVCSVLAVVLLFGTFVVLAVEHGGRSVTRWIREQVWPLRWTLYYAAAAAILFFAAFGQSAFIYQQY